MGPGTLYGAIKRMLEDELIFELETADARRRYYRLTEKGRSILAKELQRYHEAVEVAKARHIWGNAPAHFMAGEA